MAQQSLAMQDIKDLFRLKFELNQSYRQIAASLGIGASSVGDYVARFKDAGLTWPLTEDLSHSELLNRLFHRPEGVGPKHQRPLPDFNLIHLELKKKAVTLMLLWEEYREAHPEGYGYTQFCEHYNRWRKHLSVVMRQEHRAGDKLFVDYSGLTVPVIDRESRSVREAEIFVAVLGASNYTYAEASLAQDSASWIAAHGRAFDYFGGVPLALVPDNLKSGVTKICRYEPLINQNYYDMANYYGTSVVPARSYKPKDKAKAEAGVCLVQRWILARLRKRIFFSLADLNAAIAELLIKLNDKPMQRLKKSRREIYLEIEKPSLKELPQRPYQFTELAIARVNLDYHIEVQKHYYSVPFRLVGERLEIRLTQHTVEAFFDGKRIASHRRSYQAHTYTTLKEHMPESHQRHSEWSPERLKRWAHGIAPAVGELSEAIFTQKKHPEQGCRSVLGLIRLEKTFGKERLIKACQRALALKAYSYKTVQMILKNKTETAPLPRVNSIGNSALPAHENIRGAGYYQTPNPGDRFHDSRRNIDQTLPDATLNDGEFPQIAESSTGS